MIDERLTDTILYEIKAERIRQVHKYGLQRHVPEKWYVIAAEEMGELAEAMQKGTQATKPTDADSMINEAIQAAAVLVAFAEQCLEQMALFEACPTCTNMEHCGTMGRLCEIDGIGDRVD